LHESNDDFWVSWNIIGKQEYGQYAGGIMALENKVGLLNRRMRGEAGLYMGFVTGASPQQAYSTIVEGKDYVTKHNVEGVDRTLFAVQLATPIVANRLAAGIQGPIRGTVTWADVEITGAIAQREAAAGPKLLGYSAPKALPLLGFNPNTLESRVQGAYQQFYDEAWQATAADFNRGEIVIPAGQHWKTVLGAETDLAARANLKIWLRQQGISEGAAAQVAVNRWLRDPSGTGLYRIPDVRLPQEGMIFDGTIGGKSPNCPQILDFMKFSQGDAVMIVRPQTSPKVGN
jgi:hypothetical protein